MMCGESWGGGGVAASRLLGEIRPSEDTSSRPLLGWGKQKP